MAVLTQVNCLRVWADGLSDRVALYALRKVTTADTIDLAADFLITKQAIMIGTTVVTMPAGLSNDAAYLLVWGASA